MAKTGLAGAIGLGHQGAMNSLASSILYLPATSIGLNMNQNAQTLPAEIGGDFFLRGSYKASVMGSGDIAFVVRPNTFGALALMLAGQDAVSTASAGVYTHTFTPFIPGQGIDLPWFTAIKDTATLYAEQYLNTRLSTLQVSVPKSSIVTATASLVSTTPSNVTSASLGTKTFDSSPQFQTCIASVSLTPEGSGSNISSNAVQVESFNLQYGNNISNDEFVVGSYYLADMTLQQRTVQADMDFVIRDSSLYQAVYLNGGTGSWSPTIYRGSLTVTLTAPLNIPGTSTPYSLSFVFPGLDFLMMPVQLQGAEVVRGTLSTQVTLGPNGSDRFSIVLTNGIASY